MSEKNLPRVSFIIPTLNAAAMLPICLRSIRNQDYPEEKIEIIVADGGSVDDTREIARSFGAQVVENAERVAESGKRVALALTRGEFVVFTDSDNELSSRDFVRMAVYALEKNPQALGLESYYPAATGMNSFCAYLTETLHISDPVTWMMCVNPVLVEKKGAVERWTFPGGSLAYPLGANGFIFRKVDLDSIGAAEFFEDTHVALQLAQAGKREWLRLAGRGVHHYVVRGVMDFLKKRRRQTYHFLSLKHKGDLSWTRMNPRMPAWAACLLCATLIVPLAQTARGFFKTGDARWLWHPLASFVSVLGVAWGLLTFAFSKRTADAEASLQPVRQASKSKRRIVFIANCVYGDHVAGGDIHFFHMAQAAVDAGWHVRFFGGQALKSHLENRQIEAEQTCTDNKKIPAPDAESLSGQLRLLLNYSGRFCRTLFNLSEIQHDDTAYSVTDYWFDAWPVIFSRAQKKLMILGMDAPTLREIIFRSRPDVTAIRINSIYYWLSQNISLRLFRFCKNKKLFYVHPGMKSRLLKMGFREPEIVFISNGMNLKAAGQVTPQKKEFDVVWLGRVHRQKGIDELLATLVILSKEIENFRAVLVGKLDELSPQLAELNLSGYVTLAGIVSEEEKFRLFKASRAFLMPSRQESWGIVIAEALVCDVPVVAYDLPAYRPIFGGLVDYVPCFDFEIFKQKSLETVEKTRRGEIVLDAQKLAALKSEHSWEAAEKRFTATLGNF
jgi:glycosyltransferase involved in cell wall biosynthesis